MIQKLPKGFSAFIATQSLGAFNDNFFKMLIQLYVLVIATELNSTEIISQSALVFTVPFVIFGPWSGYLSDHYSKSQLMKGIKFLEIIIMSLGCLAFIYGSISMMLTALFLMATQSAFFSPAKAGFIPETCHETLISKANGIMGMTTFVSIILGTALCGIILTVFHNNTVLVALFCVSLAILGTLTSLKITKTKASQSKSPFPLNPLIGIVKDLIFLKKQRGLFLAALANSYFWLLGIIFQTNILVYGKTHLGLGSDNKILLSILPAIMGLGIALGSLLASRWSDKKVEIGLVPLGGIGLTICGIALYFTTSSYIATTITLGFAGICGGLYIIPLNAYLQTASKNDEKGRVLSTAGIMNGLFLVLGSLLYQVFAVELALQPATIYLIMGFLSIFVVIYICTVVPEYFLRFINWFITHTVYRIKIIGQDNVPLKGAALLVPNHVSFVDALIVNACLPRLIKFIMYKKIYEIPGIKTICKIMDIIPIAPYEGRGSVTKSLDRAKFQLSKKQLVCIFAEGGITRDGQMQEFKGGLESIMENQTCPIIPVYLHNLWGSIFSFEGGKAFWKRPKNLPYPVTIVFGKPMPVNSSSAEVEAAVKNLGLNLN